LDLTEEVRQDEENYIMRNFTICTFQQALLGWWNQ